MVKNRHSYCGRSRVADWPWPIVFKITVK